MSLATPIVDAPAAPAGLLRSIRRAWAGIGEDPVRILGVSMLLLALDAWVGVAAMSYLWGGRSEGLWAALAARWGLGLFFELVLIHLGQRSRPTQALSASRLLAAWPLALLERACGWVTGALLAGPIGLLAFAVAGTGAWEGAAVFFAIAFIVFLAGQALGRAPLAMVPVRVIGAGESVASAWRHAVDVPLSTHVGRAMLLGAVGIVRGFATVAGVAPALPTVPLTPLALLARLYPEEGCDPSPRA